MKITFGGQPHRLPMDSEASAVKVIGRALSFRPDDLNVREVELSELIRVFSLDFTTVWNGGGLSSASQTAWRSLIFVHGEPFGDLDYKYLGNRFSGKPIAVRRGPRAAGLIDAVRRAEKKPEPAQILWEMSILMIRELNIEALWLRRQDGGGEWVNPIAPARSALSIVHFYSRAEFEEVIAEVAKRRMNFKEVL